MVEKDIVIKGLSKDQYLELVRLKTEGDYRSWKEFFLEKAEIEK